jgi:AcrR family transcriptional regulator
MDEIARAAGVSRQTVYTHYVSRDALLRAVQERAVRQTVAALDGAELDQGAPAEALARLVSAGWQTLERYPVLMNLRVELSPDEEYALHRPILERLERLVRRGKRTGDFDRRLPTNWLLASFIALSHAAAEEVAAGRMSAGVAARSLHRTVLRVFGAGDDDPDA